MHYETERFWANNHENISEMVEALSGDPEFAGVRFGHIVQEINDTPFGWVDNLVVKFYPAEEDLDLEDFKGTLTVPTKSCANLEKMKAFLRRKAVTVKRYNAASK